MNLEGLDGSHFFGFMGALGSLALLDERARSRREPQPRLGFGRNGYARLSARHETADDVTSALFEQLQDWRPYYDKELGGIKKPKDFSAAMLVEIAGRANRRQSDVLAGLVTCVGEDTFESTLCAANGASHQNMIQDDSGRARAGDSGSSQTGPLRAVEEEL